MLKLFFSFTLLIAFNLCIAVNYDSTNVVSQGEMIPQFRIERLDGEIVQSENFKGKVVVINFFATWCGPCMQELPEIEKQIWQKYGSRSDFELLVIGREHTKAEMQKFIEAKGFKFPILADPEREIYSKFAISYIPRLYLIDKKGRIVKLNIGYNKTDFSNFIDLLEIELTK